MVTPYTPPTIADITKSSYVAADALIAQIRASIPPETSVIAATLVNINSLESSSPLGRLVTEQIAGRFVHSGYQVIEVKLRNQIYMKRNEGELVLTREVRDIAKKHNAAVIVSGTYADGKDRVFVNLKVIRLEKNIVAAAYDYTLEKDELVRSLLTPG
jgi:TolB-like protein